VLGQIEPFYYSLYSVIFRRTILFFLLGYSNYLLSRECWRNPITQKKPAIQRILNTPMGQIPCIAGFLDMNNKRIDRSTVSMLRSIFDELGLLIGHNFIFRPQGYSRVFKFSKAQCSQEFLLFEFLLYHFRTLCAIMVPKTVDWAIFRKPLPLGAKTVLCRLRSAASQIRR
jgi:hypothetical protein